MSSKEKPVVFAPATTVRLNKTAGPTWGRKNVGKDFLIESVGDLSLGVEYSVHGLGAWIPHEHLDFVSHPTAEALAELQASIRKQEQDDM